jgi:hypothetical protein
MAKFAKLAALGAFGVIGGVSAAYVAFVLVLTWPNGEGIDHTEALVAWVSVGCVVVALAWVHLVFGRTLAGMSKGRQYSVERSWD